MTGTFYTLYVIVFRSSPWSAAMDGKLYTKDKAEKIIKKQETTTKTFLGCRPETLKVITLDEHIDAIKDYYKNEGYEAGRESEINKEF